MIALSTIDMPKQNFISPEFGTKFQREVHLFLEIESSHAKNQLESFTRFDRAPTCDRQTDTDTGLIASIPAQA